jgi:hydrogenase maturation protease
MRANSNGRRSGVDACGKTPALRCADRPMIAVIGCGNVNRRDDGAGPEVMRALKASPLVGGNPEVRLLDAGTDGMAVVLAARGCRSLIIVDACQSGSEPGAVLEMSGSELQQAYRASLNLHDFRWDHALHAGRSLYGADFPKDVLVLLIEATDVDFGRELSPPVARAVEKVKARIEGLVMDRLAGMVAAP